FSFISTSTTDFYTLSLHDALPISLRQIRRTHHHARHRIRYRARRHSAASLRQHPHVDSFFRGTFRLAALVAKRHDAHDPQGVARSEEHTSELQSRGHLVCRLLLEK